MKTFNLKYSYALLILFGIILLIVWRIYVNTNTWIENFSLNLFTEIVGILLVVFLIDRIINRNRNKEKERYENIAIKQFRIPLIHQILFLLKLYKASTLTKPEKITDQIDNLFPEDFFKQIVYLDFSKDAPQLPAVQYLDYCVQEIKRFKESISRTLEKYSIYLSPDIIELIENILNSHFIFFMMQLTRIREIDKSEGIKRQYNFFMGYRMDTIIREYIDLMKSFITKVNSHLSSDNKIHISTTVWRDDNAPSLGSGRIK